MDQAPAMQERIFAPEPVHIDEQQNAVGNLQGLDLLRKFKDIQKQIEGLRQENSSLRNDVAQTQNKHIQIENSLAQTTKSLNALQEDSFELRAATLNEWARVKGNKDTRNAIAHGGNIFMDLLLIQKMNFNEDRLYLCHLVKSQLLIDGTGWVPNNRWEPTQKANKELYNMCVYRNHERGAHTSSSSGKLAFPTIVCLIWLLRFLFAFSINSNLTRFPSSGRHKLCHLFRVMNDSVAEFSEASGHYCNVVFIA